MKSTRPMFSAGWWGARAASPSAGVMDARILALFAKWVAPLVRRVHRPTVHGAENLPIGAPYLLVANHSGGAGVSELTSLITLYDELGRPTIAAMAHPVSFHLWPLPHIMRWSGSIPSTHAAAVAALGAGVSVLVFPGGDYEAGRPFWQWDRIDFNGRKGFLRVAREAGVPIVPLRISGSHLSVPILWRSSLVLPWLLVLPRLFGIKRYPLTLVGALGAALIAWLVAPFGWPVTALLCWLWLASVFPLVPVVPVTIRFDVGAPLPPSELFADADLDAAHARVLSALRALADG